MMRKLLPTLALASALLGGCSSGEDTRLAEAAIQTIRAQISAGAVADIYENASADWKNSMSRPDADAFLGAINRKLGAVKSATRTGWQNNYNTSGHWIVLSYHTQFERGTADETFTMRMADNKALLAGYRISSMAMMIN